MGDKLKPCPRCGSDDIDKYCAIGIHESRYYYFCVECGKTSGPPAPSQEQAKAAWNEWKEVEGD